MNKKLGGLLTLSVFALLAISCGTQTGSSSSSSSSNESSSDGSSQTGSSSSDSSSASSSSEGSSSSSGSSSSASSSSSLTPSGEGYYKASLSHYRLDQYEGIDTFHEVGMPSTGNVKLLVVPVAFSGSNDPQPTSSQLESIRKSYFGAASETGWESLSSFYSASSYGKLNITGEVTPVYKDSRTCLTFENQSKNSEVVSPLVSKVVTFAKSQGINLDEYDSNSDGYLDAVEMVYFTSRPLSSENGADVWWAYTSITESDPDLDNPVGERYFWSPFSMIENGYYDPDIDTHTLIHETGHMLGLDDYYSYETRGEEKSPAGGVDMMDLNIGDHNAYSKMCLGWADPFVIDGTSDDFNLTLHSFEETGEFALIRDTITDPWNGTPYDEYLILQYYTPTGLNELDSSEYPEWAGEYGHGGTYSIPGLQVFHIDARLVNQSTKQSTSKSTYAYTDTIRAESSYNKTTGLIDYASYIAASNTPSYSLNVSTGKKNSSNALITAIPATGSGSFLSTSYAASVGLSKNLFGVGKKYGSATFKQSDFSKTFPQGTNWNDGTSLDYSFSVTYNDASYCDIQFTR